MDGFDRIPDALVLFIFNSVSDIKTLIRCRAVSKRFNSLVPHTESLLLKVDRVVSSESGNTDAALLTFLRSILKSLHNLLLPKPHPIQTRSLLNSPAQILRGFEKIKNLEIELPSGDLKLEKKAVVMWRAEFGSTLRSCIIFGFREIRTSQSPMTRIPADFFDVDFAGGLKLRVVWTISALIAASARHYLLKEVVKEHGELERVVLKDREGEGTVVMDKEGLREFAEGAEPQVSDNTEGMAAAQDGLVGGEAEGEGGWERNNGGRTTVPSVRMRMRHMQKLELKGGAWMDGATLVMVRPTSSNKTVEEDEVDKMDAELALEAFGGGVYGEAVQSLLNTRGYLLEMNSF
ncbi:F-box protein At1g22220 [Juglans microcarpa x Juglans regia]|uniref:F-box protein At1g22220 n=1 Tax=Juglans microcarpa x Juglans regia TaxID=2249226 RepID=UPI001B7EE3A9|nr:F-box protein At1g22220 [Juglans microcarpa x Juglans regia]